MSSLRQSPKRLTVWVMGCSQPPASSVPPTAPRRLLVSARCASATRLAQRCSTCFLPEGKLILSVHRKLQSDRPGDPPPPGPGASRASSVLRIPSPLTSLCCECATVDTPVCKDGLAERENGSFFFSLSAPCKKLV